MYIQSQIRGILFLNKKKNLTSLKVCVDTLNPKRFSALNRPARPGLGGEDRWTLLWLCLHSRDCVKYLPNKQTCPFLLDNQPLLRVYAEFRPSNEISYTGECTPSIKFDLLFLCLFNATGMGSNLRWEVRAWKILFATINFVQCSEVVLQPSMRGWSVDSWVPNLFDATGLD